ncbi:TetR/AcrR family transcriptional regulator [Microbacterium album]|uniref:HTH tetR-type domain-containing protein n=1 Tax=Microbacterium album TaxID=2053191 RepID=A0A917MJY5_9MICO|nr:TetR/AcrR family transcriptional regulator [Microbacterium album]GGH33636.1 hypothetical protein GCM10010921_00730 [Microbacterium album]
MATSPGLRPPRQARSHLTLQRILDAGRAVFAENGYDGFTIAEVCRRSGVSAGAVYTRFRDKDALVLAVHDHAMAGLLDEVRAMFAPAREWDELPTAVLVERAVQLLFAHFRRHAPIVRAAILRAAVDPTLRASGARAVEAMSDAFTARLLDRAADFPHPDRAAAVRSAFAMSFEAVSWDVAFGAEFRATGALGPDDLDERVPALCRMLLLTPPG